MRSTINILSFLVGYIIIFAIYFLIKVCFYPSLSFSKGVVVDYGGVINRYPKLHDADITPSDYSYPIVAFRGPQRQISEPRIHRFFRFNTTNNSFELHDDSSSLKMTIVSNNLYVKLNNNNAIFFLKGITYVTNSSDGDYVKEISIINNNSKLQIEIHPPHYLVNLNNTISKITPGIYDPASEWLNNLFDFLKPKINHGICDTGNIYLTKEPNSANYKVGDSVIVYYHNDNPEEADLYSFGTYWLPLRAIIILIIVCFIWTGINFVRYIPKDS